MQPLAFSETVLVVDDEENFVTLTVGVLDRAGYDALGATSLSEASERLKQHFVDLILIDERLGRDSGVRFLGEIREQHPGLTGIVVSAGADLTLAQRAMRVGAVDILAKPVAEEDLLATTRRVLDSTDLIREARRNRWIAERTARPPEIVGNSRAIRDVLETVGRVAASSSSVLIQGESGTGKELIALAIHQASPRRHKPIVSVNMAAIPPEMIEAELFGAARGSYTGSVTERKGYFEEANGSTLFLDEIGDAPLKVQVRLLRALEERQITRVGETRPRKIDIRLIAATNSNLSRDIQSGKFRSDLFFRLSVVPIAVPPLRERVEDIEPIANHLLSRFARENRRSIRGFEPEALRTLRQYSWPGNVRELRNVVERAVVLAKGSLLTSSDLLLEQDGQARAEWHELLDQPLDGASAAFERRYFERLMQRADGNKTKAADLAGRDRSTIYTYLKKLGLIDSE
jgi:DNA-binding NtrC family response regulator